MILKNFSLQIGTQIFKAFSDEARVRIIHLLYQKGELTITDLEYILDFTQTKTSRHITYLKNAGLVSATKKDQWVIYTLKEEVMDMVNRIIEFLRRDVTLQKDLETYEILNSNRELAAHKISQKELRR